MMIIVIGILAFIGFCIYFVFKILEFVIRAINLYEKIVTREDIIIQLLIDIRDNNKSVSAADWSERPIENVEETEEDYSQEQELDDSVDYQDDYESKDEAKEEKKRLAEIQMEEERNEEAYYAIREKLIHEIRDDLKTEQEISILKNMLRLTYQEFKKLESNPKDLSDTGVEVLHLILEKPQMKEI